MRIPLKLVNEQLLLSATFSAPNHHVSLNVLDFVVDTGSNKTTLGYGDVLRLNVPQRGLVFREDTHIGGQTMGLHELSEVRFSLEDFEGKLQTFKAKRFLVSIPKKKNEADRQKAKQIPSIMGLDFLRENRLSLYCNPVKDEAYLEKEE